MGWRNGYWGDGEDRECWSAWEKRRCRKTRVQEDEGVHCLQELVTGCHGMSDVGYLQDRMHSQKFNR